MTLEEAIEAFKNLYEHLKDPEEASGKCGAVSYRFVRFLKDNFVPEAKRARCVDYSACTARHHPLYPELLTVAQDKEIEDYQHRGVGQWTGHSVVGIGRLRVDWTASQFDPSSPFPLTWSVRR
jgi:hypothetical protein